MEVPYLWIGVPLYTYIYIQGYVYIWGYPYMQRYPLYVLALSPLGSFPLPPPRVASEIPIPETYIFV